MAVLTWREASEYARKVAFEYDAGMDGNQFQAWLRLGLGRAILYAQDHDVRDFRGLIVDACLHCYAYDPQIEGTRADYMLELVDLTPDKKFYYDNVLRALTESGDNWDTVQRFRFAACLGMEGNQGANRAMYQNFSPGTSMGEAIGNYFVQMDGVDGLLHAAEKIGTLLMTTTESVDLGWMMSVARENLGDEQAREALRKAGEGNPRIEAYRLAVEPSRKRLDELGKSIEITSISYDQIKAELPEMSFIWITSWGEKASDADIERAAHGLVAAQSPKEQHAHLRIFSRRRFPGDIRLLLSLVNVDEERVGLVALIALSQITDPSVRELALRLIKTRAKWRGQATELLLRNFRPGDHAVALRWFEAEDDAETRHSMGSDLIHLCEIHPDKSAAPGIMLAIYETGPCSFCRGNAVRKLVELNALSDDLRKECAYDANDEIRELIKGPDPQQTQT